MGQVYCSSCKTNSVFFGDIFVDPELKHEDDPREQLYQRLCQIVMIKQAAFKFIFEHYH
jgi:hypothetical protein